MFGVVGFIVWICVVIWGLWYVNVQLERFDTSNFNKLREMISEKMCSASGVLWLLGVILYSPYVFPLRAVAIWFITVLFLFYLIGV